MSRVKALCFDVDGTLADTDDYAVARVANILQRVPLMSARRAARVARQIVMGAESPVNAAYGWLDRMGLDGTLASIKGTNEPLPDDHEPHAMVPDVKEMLDILVKRYPMSTISTGSGPRVEAFLEHYQVRDHFTCVVTAQTTPRMKPFPDPLFHAAKAMGVSPEQCLMIGDTTVDMRTAVAAGAQSVGVLCGFGKEDELRRRGAGLILKTTSDLLGVLCPEDDPLESESAVPETQEEPA
ncbi:MAG: HAD family hydrolase [Rhodothermales bacterium]|nr:HAD family hydrolase [Rhodothermales bacterium]